MKRRLAKKLIFWFAVIILPAFLLTNWIVRDMIGSSNQAAVEKDLAEYKANCEIYIARVMLSQGAGADAAEFNRLAGSVMDELSAILGNKMEVYSLDGTLLGSTFDREVNRADTRELEYALEGKTAYTVVYGEKTEVYFSFPATVQQLPVGIIRIYRDYTVLYENGNFMSNIVLVCTLALVCAALAVTLVSNAKVVRPVTSLRNAIVHMQQNPEDVQLLEERRKDEIGELTAAYNTMSLTIRDQLMTIRQEKENLDRTLEYRKTFYDNVTPELKPPLTVILGYADMMQQTDMSDPAFNKQALEEILKETRRLRDMVGELLEVSRQVGQLPEEFAPVELGALLTQLARSMNDKARRYGAQLRLELPEKEPVVNGSEEKLRQLLINLMDNAIKYKQPGGEILVQAAQQDGEVTVQVKNPCRPMSEQELEKIFLPFYQGQKEEREEGSVGLGLAVCKNVAEAHGGDIRALWEDGWLCMQLSLPAYKNQAKGELP
ncbi:MAG: HAMP domain-containing histidine kinase [Christensenellaceae bacterium]|nr:HAMP domain-containing histidine kinase [Christensenellaceae bacterium]